MARISRRSSSDSGSFRFSCPAATSTCPRGGRGATGRGQGQASDGVEAPHADPAGFMAGGAFLGTAQRFRRARGIASGSVTRGPTIPSGALARERVSGRFGSELPQLDPVKRGMCWPREATRDLLPFGGVSRAFRLSPPIDSVAGGPRVPPLVLGESFRPRRRKMPHLSSTCAMPPSGFSSIFCRVGFYQMGRGSLPIHLPPPPLPSPPTPPRPGHPLSPPRERDERRWCVLATHRLDRPHTEVVVVLLGELLRG